MKHENEIKAQLVDELTKRRQQMDELEKTITHLQRKQDELQGSESMAHILLNACQSSVFLIDIRGVIQAANKAAAQALGKDVKEIIGRSMVHFASPEVYEKRKQKGLEAIHSGKPVRFEDQYGGMFLDTTIHPIMDEQGSVTKLAVFSHNITDLKLAERALRDREKRYALATTAGHVGVWDWTLETNEIYLDPNLKAMLGYSDQDIRNDLDDWGGRVHPDDRALVMKEATAHLEGRRPQYVVEHRMLHKDGSIRWFLARGNAVHDDQGKPVRMLGTDTDITERKRIEEALENARDALEQKVTERTEELLRANEQLSHEIQERRRAEEELEAKNRSLEEVNHALKILLKRRDADKTELEDKILANVKELVLPYLEKMKNGPLDTNQTAFLGILESNLHDIVSPFSQRLSVKYANFTPAEIQVADLVKHGKNTKEIANLLNLSKRTVEFYRLNMRKKLGLKDKKTNLRTCLLSLQ